MPHGWKVLIVLSLFAAPAFAATPCVAPGRPVAYAPDPTFAKGPYLMHTTPTSAVVMWESAASGPGAVSWSSGGQPSRRMVEEAPHRVHAVRLTGLEPDTRYSYRVSVHGERSRVHAFWTAPRPGSPIRYTVWGDSRSQPPFAAAIVRDMAAFDPYLNINVGDVVSHGDARDEWGHQYFEPLRGLGHSVPSYVAIGNHERDDPNFYRFVSYPHPPGDPAHESYYSFTYGNTFFLVIDTNKPLTPDETGQLPAQARWLLRELKSEAARQATWRVAFGHHPAFSEGWSSRRCRRYAGSDRIRDHVLPLLAEHAFHVYFAGHTHDYERGMWDGMLHVVTGGGGARLDTQCRDLDAVEVFAAVHHHVRVEATCEELRIEAIDTAGDVIDRVLLLADEPGVAFVDGDEDT